MGVCHNRAEVCESTTRFPSGHSRRTFVGLTTAGALTLALPGLARATPEAALALAPVRASAWRPFLVVVERVNRGLFQPVDVDAAVGRLSETLARLPDEEQGTADEAVVTLAGAASISDVSLTPQRAGNALRAALGSFDAKSPAAPRYLSAELVLGRAARALYPDNPRPEVAI